MRFEPGETKTVTLVEISGKRVISGGNNIASGKVEISRVDEILARLSEGRFAHVSALPLPLEAVTPLTIDRAAYAATFGPTVGDLVRLGDTDLWVRVEMDYTVYGDECKFGGGKTLREGMGQANGRLDKDTLDLVITNALVVDYTGIFKVSISFRVLMRSIN